MSAFLVIQNTAQSSYFQFYYTEQRRRAAAAANHHLGGAQALTASAAGLSAASKVRFDHSFPLYCLVCGQYRDRTHLVLGTVFHKCS